MIYWTIYGDIEDERENIEENYEDEAKKQLLHEAIDSLSNEEKDVIIKKYYQQLSLENQHEYYLLRKAQRNINKFLLTKNN